VATFCADLWLTFTLPLTYFHGEKFTGGPDGQWERDAKLIEEAHAVLKEAQKFAFNEPGGVVDPV
jgi:hypothetical protein